MDIPILAEIIRKHNSRSSNKFSGCFLCDVGLINPTRENYLPPFQKFYVAMVLTVAHVPCKDEDRVRLCGSGSMTV